MHQLKRIHPNKRSVPVGRGGKRGKTSGRGGKGQTARAGHKIYPQMRDMIKRIPKLRGRGKHSFKTFRDKPVPVNLGVLEHAFENGAVVTPETLLSAGIVSTKSGQIPRIKILGNGVLTKKIAVSECSLSEGARAAVVKAGGEVKSV